MIKLIVLFCFNVGVLVGTVNPDDALPTPDLIKKYGYSVEIHKVTTTDGYILTLHRIPQGLTCNSGNKASVILQHGLFQSSADWVFTGPDKGLAFILADSCYDVWLGNSRGNDYSQEHVSLNPNTSTKYWDFEWEEMGIYDLPAMVDHILNVTGRSYVLYTAHGQGTTVSFMGNMFNPDLAYKIKAFFNMGPITYLMFSTNLLLQLITKTEPLATIGVQLLGNTKFDAGAGILELANQITCNDPALIPPILCTNLIFLVGGYSKNFNNSLLPTLTAHTPSAVSTKQLLHYGQCYNRALFTRFEYGPPQNLIRYGSILTPVYDLKKVTIPTYLYLGKRDSLTDPIDVNRMIEELGNVVKVYTVSDKTFVHNDFVYAINAKELVYDELIADMDRVVANNIS